MPWAPWHAAQVAALVAPAAASPWIGVWLRRSSNCGVTADARPTTIATHATEATIAARVATFMAASSQLHVEHHADQVGAVMRLRPEVGVDPVVDHQVVLQAEIVPIGEAAGFENVEYLHSDHPRDGDVEAELQRVDVVMVVREGIADVIDERLLGDGQCAGRGEYVADLAERVGVGVAQVGTHAPELVAEREAGVVIALVIEALPLIRERKQRSAQRRIV